MKLSKKVSAVALSMVLALTSFISPLSHLNVSAEDTESSTPLFYSECEDLELSSDLQIATSIYGTEKPGYSGDGFVWMQSSGTISFTVDVPEDGMYSISTRYMQELSADGRLQYLYVNGKSTGSYMLPYTTEWADFSFGRQRLNAGTNTIEIKSGWGFAYFDTVTVGDGNLPDLSVEPVLADSQATENTQILMNYLTSVYGEHIISGQQEIYGSGNDGNYELEFDWIEDLTGELPAIRGFDFMNYNPLYGWEDGTTDRMIDWVNNRNGIATVCCHMNVPKDFSSYELGEAVDWKDVTYVPSQTDFDTANAVVPGTKEYEYLQLFIEDIAEQLTILQNNNVPVIFRPFHEAEGNGGVDGEGAWFWWGAAGADVYKQLWQMLYTELTDTYDLHNIIWEYNSYTYSTSAAWYPGDNYVDIVGYDKYNTVYNRYDGLSNCPNEDAISSIFYDLVDLTDGKKMVSMPENDTIPSVSNMTIEKAGWLYFCPWYGEHLMDESKNYKSTLIETYQSDYCITLDELPNLKADGQTTTTSTPATTTSPEVTVTPEETASPEVTVTPEETASPEVTVTPEETASPEVTVTPEETTSPEVTVTPEETTSPEVTSTPEETATTSTSGVKPVVKVTTTEGGSINQQYTITADGTESVDLSKLAIRYYYDKTGTKEQSFWCDNAGLQLSESPYYVNLSSNVIATFYDGYVEITFDSTYSIKPGSGSITMGVRFAQSDWSSYTDFVGKDTVVYYDGAIVE